MQKLLFILVLAFALGFASPAESFCELTQEDHHCHMRVFVATVVTLTVGGLIYGHRDILFGDPAVDGAAFRPPAAGGIRNGVFVSAYANSDPAYEVGLRLGLRF